MMAADRRREEVGAVVDLCSRLDAAAMGDRLEGVVVMTRGRAAELLDCSVKTVDRLAAAGRLDKRNFGHGPRITLTSLRAHLRKNTNTRTR